MVLHHRAAILEADVLQCIRDLAIIIGPVHALVLAAGFAAAAIGCVRHVRLQSGRCAYRLTPPVHGAAKPDTATRVAPAARGRRDGRRVAARAQSFTNSTRRFSARPSSVALSAIGLSWPNPRDSSRAGSMPSPTSAPSTLRARAV